MKQNQLNPTSQWYTPHWITGESLSVHWRTLKHTLTGFQKLSRFSKVNFNNLKMNSTDIISALWTQYQYSINWKIQHPGEKNDAPNVAPSMCKTPVTPTTMPWCMQWTSQASSLTSQASKYKFNIFISNVHFNSTINSTCKIRSFAWINGKKGFKILSTVRSKGYYLKAVHLQCCIVYQSMRRR